MGWILWHIKYCRLFNARSSLYIYIKYIGFGWVGVYGTSIIVGYLMPNPFLYISTVLFQIIQFSISTQFSSLWPIDRALSGAITPSQSESGSDGNKGVLCIFQRSSITGASSSDCSVLYLGYPLEESYPFVEMQSVYSTAPVDWAIS